MDNSEQESCLDTGEPKEKFLFTLPENMATWLRDKSRQTGLPMTSIIRFALLRLRSDESRAFAYPELERRMFDER